MREPTYLHHRASEAPLGVDELRRASQALAPQPGARHPISGGECFQSRCSWRSRCSELEPGRRSGPWPIFRALRGIALPGMRSQMRAAFVLLRAKKFPTPGSGLKTKTNTFSKSAGAEVRPNSDQVGRKAIKKD